VCPLKECEIGNLPATAAKRGLDDDKDQTSSSTKRPKSDTEDGHVVIPAFKFPDISIPPISGLNDYPITIAGPSIDAIRIPNAAYFHSMGRTSTVAGSLSEIFSISSNIFGSLSTLTFRFESETKETNSGDKDEVNGTQSGFDTNNGNDDDDDDEDDEQ
jgi:hypothetical protein